MNERGGKPSGSASRGRLPPGQAEIAAGCWPTVGERLPGRDPRPWTITIQGLVEEPRILSLPDLRALPRVERQVDIHCVTRWSRLAAPFGGVLLRDVLLPCRPLPGARCLSFTARSDAGHHTSLEFEEALSPGTLIALEHEGRPLEEEHGGPVRVIVPGRYFYKSLKWLERIDVLSEDRPGLREAAIGLHGTGDPWKEERYAPASLDAGEVDRRIASRDFAGGNLRGIDCDGLDLTGLDARGAVLRGATFRGARLVGACLDGANLTNARFQGADLRRATIRPLGEISPDAEGADFRGADLRGVEIRRAFLLGSTFCPADGEDGGQGPAILDETAAIDGPSLDTLAPLPLQASFLRPCLKA